MGTKNLVWPVVTIICSMIIASGIYLGLRKNQIHTTTQDYIENSPSGYVTSADSVSTKVDEKYPTVSFSRITDKVDVEIATETEMLFKPTVSSSIENSELTEEETKIFKPKITPKTETLYKRKLPVGDSWAWMKEPPPPDSNEPIITYEMVQAQELERKEVKLYEILEEQKSTSFIQTPSGHFKFLKKDGTVRVYSPELHFLYMYTTSERNDDNFKPYIILDNLIKTWELAAQQKHQQAIASSKDDLSLQETAKINLLNDIQKIALTERVFRERLNAIYENDDFTQKEKYQRGIELLRQASTPIVMPTQPLEFRVKSE